MIHSLTYLLNGAAAMFFGMAAVNTMLCARRSGSRPHLIFAICLAWMTLIEVKEFFLSFDPAYDYEILGPGYTIPDLFTLPLLSLFFFELVMPGRVTARHGLRLLAPFILLGAAYAVGLCFIPRTQYLSLGELWADLPGFLPMVLLAYILYAFAYCVFAMRRVVTYSRRYASQIAQTYSFTERIHLRWMRWMSVLMGFYLFCYIAIITFTTAPLFTIAIHLLTLSVWTLLYGCVMQYRIPEIIRDYWQAYTPAEATHEESSGETAGRIEQLRQQVWTAIDERRLYLDPRLTIIDLAAECMTNRTHLSQFFNNELGLSFRDYINRCRVEHAVQLMATDNYKIEELALVSGFGSTASFYRAFAREKGTTPQQWLLSWKAGGGKLCLSIAEKTLCKS